MVKNVSSNQVLTSEESYRSALANIQRIKQAIDFTIAGKQVVDLPKYIEHFSTLYAQFETRTKLGVNADLQKLHEELDTALQSLSARVVTVAAKVSLDAATKAANASKPASTSKPWTLRQWVKYGVIGATVAGIVVWDPGSVLKQIGNTPNYATAAYYFWQRTAPTLGRVGETFGKVFGGASLITSQLLNLARNAATGAGLKNVAKPPSNPTEQLGDGAGWLACVSACSVGLGIFSNVFPKGMLAVLGRFLPSSWLACAATCTAESVYPGSTAEVLTTAQNAVGKATALAKIYGPQVMQAVQDAAETGRELATQYGSLVAAAVQDGVEKGQTLLQNFDAQAAKTVAAIRPYSDAVAQDIEKGAKIVGSALFGAVKEDMNTVWNATASAGQFLGTQVRRYAPPILDGAKTGTGRAWNVTREGGNFLGKQIQAWAPSVREAGKKAVQGIAAHPNWIVRPVEGLAGFVLLERAAVRFVPGVRQLVLGQGAEPVRLPAAAEAGVAVAPAPPAAAAVAARPRAPEPAALLRLQLANVRQLAAERFRAAQQQLPAREVVRAAELQQHAAELQRQAARARREQHLAPEAVRRWDNRVAEAQRRAAAAQRAADAVARRVPAAAVAPVAGAAAVAPAAGARAVALGRRERAWRALSSGGIALKRAVVAGVSAAGAAAVAGAVHVGAAAGKVGRVAGRILIGIARLTHRIPAR